MESKEVLRIDKWLWAVRIFKTRSMASKACKAGKVRIDNQPVKPSREVRKEMILTVQTGPLTKTLKVRELLFNRVGAKLVDEYLEDLTPAEEYAKLEAIRQQPLKRFRGTGRPTKKERRDLDTWFGWD